MEIRIGILIFCPPLQETLFLDVHGRRSEVSLEFAHTSTGGNRKCSERLGSWGRLLPVEFHRKTSFLLIFSMVLLTNENLSLFNPILFPLMIAEVFQFHPGVQHHCHTTFVGAVPIHLLTR